MLTLMGHVEIKITLDVERNVTTCIPWNRSETMLSNNDPHDHEFLAADGFLIQMITRLWKLNRNPGVLQHITKISQPWTCHSSLYYSKKTLTALPHVL